MNKAIKNKAIKSILVRVMVSGLTLLSMGMAHAELIINNEVNHQPSYQAVNQAIHNPSQLQTISQIPTDDSIITLMQVMRVDAQIDAIIQSQQMAIEVIEAQNEQQAENSNNVQLPGDDTELSDEQKRIREQIQGILGQSSKVLQGSAERIKDNLPTKTDLTQAYITAAKAHYTQAEVDAQIAFYNTPVGQSILDKRPQVTAEFMQVAMSNSMAKSMPKSEDVEGAKSELEVLLPQIRELLEGVF